MDDPPKVEKRKQENIIKMAKVNTTKNERQSVLWLSQETVDLVTFTEEILNENFIFCAVSTVRVPSLMFTKNSTLPLVHISHELTIETCPSISDLTPFGSN